MSVIDKALVLAIIAAESDELSEPTLCRALERIAIKIDELPRCAAFGDGMLAAAVAEERSGCAAALDSLANEERDKATRLLIGEEANEADCRAEGLESGAAAVRARGEKL